MMSSFGSWGRCFAVAACVAFLLDTARGEANDFSGAGKLDKKEVEDDLMQELVKSLKGSKSGRLSELHSSLARMYTALPKEADGNLAHNVVRYALHRLLLKEHGWFIKGLEPESAQQNPSAFVDSVSEWVPSYLQTVVEKQMKGSGISLQELTALAATLEDVVHTEEERRLHKLYQAYGIPEETTLDKAQATELIDAYMMVFIRGGDMQTQSAEDIARKLDNFKQRYVGWDDLERWTRKEQKALLDGSGTATYKYDDIVRVAKAVGAHFGAFNDIECLDLKKTLLSIEDTKGRVRLGSFYNMSLHSHWSFNEKKEYLRDLGALDDSDPSSPKVILPNYLASRPNCLEASEFYAVCCRNECEDLMGKLEETLAVSMALPSDVIRIVKDLPSDTVRAPRELPSDLLEKLDQVAAANGGRIPLHGRLFAMWMHHAYPRECPYPHKSGTTNPQTADEWMSKNKQASVGASEEEMVCYVNGPCADGAKAETAKSVELPWSGEEELLVDEKFQAPRERAGASDAASLLEAADEVVNGSLGEAFRQGLRTFTLAAIALGLALASRRQYDGEKERQQGETVWAPVLVLLVFPLAVLTVEYGVGMSTNEIFLCGLCWCLAGMLAKRSFLDGACRYVSGTPVGPLLGWRADMKRGAAADTHFASFQGV